MRKRLTRRDGANARPSLPIVVEFLLDETGSMASHFGQTIGGFNDFLDEQRRNDGACLLTLTKFNNENGSRTPYVDADLRVVPQITATTFCPTGGTPLRDAVLQRLAALEQRLAGWDQRPAVLFVVMTDGEDNSSRATLPEVRNAVLAATERGVTCVYLGATPNALEIATGLGFAPGNSRSFATAEMRETMRGLSAATTAYRATAATLTGASTDYFSSVR